MQRVGRRRERRRTGDDARPVAINLDGEPRSCTPRELQEGALGQRMALGRPRADLGVRQHLARDDICILLHVRALVQDRGAPVGEARPGLQGAAVVGGQDGVAAIATGGLDDGLDDVRAWRPARRFLYFPRFSERFEGLVVQGLERGPERREVVLLCVVPYWSKSLRRSQGIDAQSDARGATRSRRRT